MFNFWKLFTNVDDNIRLAIMIEEKKSRTENYLGRFLTAIAHIKHTAWYIEDSRMNVIAIVKFQHHRDYLKFMQTLQADGLNLRMENDIQDTLVEYKKK